MKDRNLNHSDNWGTPKEFYDKLNNEFNFNFDPCPLNHNLDLWDGLKMNWKERNFINPPYSSDEYPCKKNCKKKKCLERGYHTDCFIGGKESFVKKAIEESKKGKLCVMLLPVSTSTKLFHNLILPENPEIRFIFKRIKFCGINTKGEYVTTKAPMHDSMVVIFGGRKWIK